VGRFRDTLYKHQEAENSCQHCNTAYTVDGKEISNTRSSLHDVVS